MALLIGFLGWTACRESPELAHTLESPEAVARAVISGFAGKNADALREVALTEDEFRELVWPKLPSSRPERNLPFDYVWKDLLGKSEANLRNRMAKWTDRGFVVVKVAFRGKVTDYGDFKVHRDSELVLRDQDGQEQTSRLFGSVIEYRGRFKVFSYVVD